MRGLIINKRNRAKCAKCGDVVESKFTHDFQMCKCGAIFVDGGKEYSRYGGELKNFIIMGDNDEEK